MRRLALAIALCATVTLSRTAWAQDGAGVPLPLHVLMRREAAPFQEPRYTAMITEGKNKFAFLVPEGFYLRDDPASGTCTLANAAGNCSITFTVLSVDSSDTSDFNADVCRAWVLRDFSSGKIVQEFSGSAADGKGPGFDLQWKASGDLVECKRVLYLSSSAGLLKFTATANTNHFDHLKSVLGIMLHTFRLSTDGVLKVPALPTQS
jgi:hypothetical protein